jgi:hypothetical protein
LQLHRLVLSSHLCRVSRLRILSLRLT